MSGQADQKTGIISRSPALRLRAVRLAVVEGPDRGAELQVREGRARVGTAACNELRLSDPTVSRLHCEIHVGRERVRVIDGGSTNGTFIESLRVHGAELSSDTAVRVGNTVVAVRLDEGSTFVELSRSDRLGRLVGRSTAMRRIYALLQKIAPAPSTVLLQGETGTGKDLVAQTLHELSPRADGPFVAVDCGSIAETLIESELFGHVRGAFSGAVEDRRGVLEEANGGTAFFDEIGELPLALQPKLLRVLETRQVRPVGENTPRPIDVRIVAATNRSLARSVNEGTFREDLYYRLAVVELELPPLRERREDIPVLAGHFLEQLTGGEGELPQELVDRLSSRSWPGNVRELRNAVERSLVLGWPRGSTVDAQLSSGGPPADRGSDEVRARVSTHLPLREARAAWSEQFDIIYLRALLDRTSGNVTRAAELAGVNRRTLQRLMVRLDLRTSDEG